MPAVPSTVFNKRDRKHHLGEAILHVSSMRDNQSYRAAKAGEITFEPARNFLFPSVHRRSHVSDQNTLNRLTADTR